MKLDLVTIKEIVTGILVLIGVAGTFYNGFAPEDEARWAYSALAPDVDLALEQSDGNADLMVEQERRIVRLEEKAKILEKLLIGQLVAQGILDKDAMKRLDRGQIDFDEIQEEVHEEEERPPPVKRVLPSKKRRARPKAPWIQQAE